MWLCSSSTGQRDQEEEEAEAEAAATEGVEEKVEEEPELERVGRIIGFGCFFFFFGCDGAQ